MSILRVSRLSLDLNDPRDRRIHERIEDELAPLADDILAEYRAGYTEEEVKALARQRAERRDRRRKTREKATKASAEEANATRKELSDRNREVLRRVWELTDAGPVRWSEIAALLRQEGIDRTEVWALRDAADDRLRFSSSGGGVLIERAA